MTENVFDTCWSFLMFLDVNDNAPVFSSDVLNFYAPENLTMGSTVAEILASDPDEGQNAVIEYAIVSGPDAESFALITRPNQPPLLSNLIELDHESSRKQYKLVIRASSPPLQTDVTCNVFVTDVNGNNHLFLFKVRNISRRIKYENMTRRYSCSLGTEFSLKLAFLSPYPRLSCDDTLSNLLVIKSTSGS